LRTTASPGLKHSRHHLARFRADRNQAFDADGQAGIGSLSTAMGSSVDNPAISGPGRVRLYNCLRPSTDAELCMVKEVFHVNHFGHAEVGGGFQPVNKALTSYS